ncbi:MAG TPA: hypothetical protein DIU35_15100 [Candidatus Latescibacteria bacterium]|nr:hypothetical protein [Candidatus Latescibacterota bacterium]
MSHIRNLPTGVGGLVREIGLKVLNLPEVLPLHFKVKPPSGHKSKSRQASTEPFPFHRLGQPWIPLYRDPEKEKCSEHIKDPDFNDSGNVTQS